MEGGRPQLSTSYLVFFVGRLIVSTTVVFGFFWACFTGTNFPEPASRPILAISASILLGWSVVHEVLPLRGPPRGGEVQVAAQEGQPEYMGGEHAAVGGRHDALPVPTPAGRDGAASACCFIVFVEPKFERDSPTRNCGKPVREYPCSP